MRGAGSDDRQRGRASGGRRRRAVAGPGLRDSHLRVVKDNAVAAGAGVGAEAWAGARAGVDPERRRRARSFVAGAAVFTLAAISLAVWSLQRGTTISAVERRFECAQATWGSVEQGLEVDGVVVRDERVYLCPIAGKIKLMVPEGERLRAGTVVAEVARDEARQQVEPSLVSAKEELARFDAHARARLAELEREVASCKLEVENEKRALDRARVSRDAAAEEKHRSALTRAKAEFAAAEGRLAKEQKALEAEGRALASKVAEHEAEYRLAVCEMQAERPGVVSFQVDGLEQLLTPSGARDLPPDRVRSLVASPVLLRDGAEVAQGQRIFRLIDNFRLFVLVVLSGDDAGALKSWSRGRVRFPAVPGGPFSACVAFQDRPGPSGERAVLLEISGFPEELYYVRHTRVKLITKTASGLAIPRRAVIRGNGGDIVYVPVNLGVARKPVKVVAGDRDTVIVQGLKEGQRVLTNPAIVHEAHVTIWH